MFEPKYAQIRGWELLYQHVKCYHVDQISRDQLPSGHTSRRWGVGNKRADGAVVVEPDPWPEQSCEVNWSPLDRPGGLPPIAAAQSRASVRVAADENIELAVGIEVIDPDSIAITPEARPLSPSHRLFARFVTAGFASAVRPPWSSEFPRPGGPAPRRGISAT